MPAPLGDTPVEWLDRHRVLGPQTLCIHTIRLAQSDIARLARAGVAIAHCPVSNHAHGHGAALTALLDTGIRVGLGTDSVASVGVLDLLAEARAARALASLSADTALALCTLAGARALGLESEAGSLRPGKRGDCVVMAIPRGAGSTPTESVLASGPDDVIATYLAGRPVFRKT